MKNKRTIFNIAVALAVLLFASGLWWISSFELSFFEWEPYAPGTVVAESAAPDRSIVAKVIAGSTEGRYIFELCDIRSRTAASKNISAPVGYHRHLITIRWEEGSRQAIATIDHDFGEGNLEFSLSR